MGFLGTFFLGLFGVCFRKMKTRQNTLYRIITLLVIAAILLTISAAVYANGDESGWLCIEIYAVWFGWRIIADIVVYIKNDFDKETAQSDNAEAETDNEKAEGENGCNVDKPKGDFKMTREKSTYIVRGTECGTNSNTLYETCSARFGWDMYQAKQFGTQGKPLYAREATPEGDSVWCISYSNLSAGKGGRWTNEITDCGATIEEYWEWITTDYIHDFYDMTNRVVFAKNRRGQYEFLGVFRPDPLPNRDGTIGPLGAKKTYRRISERYPENTSDKERV